MTLKAASFAVIGVVNTLVDLGVFLAAYNVFELSLIPANVLAWLVAVSGSYVMNCFITFAAESGRQAALAGLRCVRRIGCRRRDRQHGDPGCRLLLDAGAGGEAAGDRGELRGQFLAVAFRRVSDARTAGRTVRRMIERAAGGR